MRRYPILVVLSVLTIPVGLSIQGCANKNALYCNGLGYGYQKDQTVNISLQPQLTGISVAFSQIGQLQTPTATNCLGTSSNVSSFTYGTTDRTIADVSPTGQVCGGTWNLNTPAVADYTTCIPTGKEGVAYMTASAAGVASNQVAVYSHPPLTSLALAGPTNPTTGAPLCLSQGQTSQLDATAYTTCSSTGQPPIPNCSGSPSCAPGQPVLLCSPSYTNSSSGPIYGACDCNSIIGHITYSPASSSIVTINQDGIATAQAPGSTLIASTISSTGSSTGYFYTCPPKTIALSVPVTGATSANVTPNTPQPLTATVTDTNNNIINGLSLDYVSTNPGNIPVSGAGSVTAAFPSTAAITAICQPTECNPAPINLIGSGGTGVPIVSNSVLITSPGQSSTYIWAASPNSPYFVPTDLTTGTTGNSIKLPYTPNSMVIDQGGNNLYFGSYWELMIYSAVTNSLTTEVPAVPGVVLAVSPSNTTVLINDQYRGLFYLYSPAVTGGSGASYSSFGGVGQRAAFSPDGETVYIVGQNTLYIHNTYTGWSVEPLPPGQGGPTTGVCPANNSSSIPFNPNTNPPNSPSNPNNAYNSFCSPDLAVTIPSTAVFLTGSPTAAYGICPETTVNPVVNYPESATVATPLDHIAATFDGKHIIGATANPPSLTDVSINVPIDACPTAANGQTTGFTFAPPPTFAQASLAGFGITNINQVVAATNSSEAFITYSSNATTAPAGGALLPVYEPAAQPGNLGTLTSVKLAGNAIDPVSGVFSLDNTIFFVSTTGDDQIHLINTTTLTDTRQINPKLTDVNGNPVAPIFLAVKPRPTT